jgi:succinate-acetate transporter protein
MLAGLMCFANHNVYGGTLFTAFAFNWALNWWVLDGLAKGQIPDGSILVATEALSLVVFLVLTYGFGFFSKLLFLLLLDIDVLYIAKLAKAGTGLALFDTVVAICTVVLALLALWIAFAMMINPVAGRPIFAMPGPLFEPAATAPEMTQG